MSIYALADGGSHYNQDPKKRQAYGSFLIVEGPIPFEMSGATVIIYQKHQFENKTNNEAEYLIIQKCLAYCLENHISNIHIGTDSELVYNQLNGTYKIRSERLKPLIEDIKMLMALVGQVQMGLVPRDVNVFYLGH